MARRPATPQLGPLPRPMVSRFRTRPRLCSHELMTPEDRRPDIRRYDRAAEDLGNIVALEHVNVRIPDQGLATLFYISGLGLTRDPYLMTSTDNMWANVGRSQFHMPTGAPQVLRGHVGLVLPDREALLRRLPRAEEAARRQWLILV